MEPLELLAAGLCVPVGIFVGLLGGGGSVLLVPLFVFVAKLPVGEAIATSLLVVALSAASGAVHYLRRGFVNRRLVVLFIAPGVFTSYLGGQTAGYLDSRRLMSMFGGIMILIAVILYRKPSREGPDVPAICRPDPALSVAVGAGIGFLTGLLGVGGGFLIVPAIALLMKCSMQTAVGTSLAIMAVNSAAGFIGHLPVTELDPPLGAAFLGATLAGSIAGASLSGRLNAAVLQRAFAIAILLIGSFLMFHSLYGRGGAA